MKILVAEDDKITLRLLEARLREWGNEVVACSDGLEAWTRLQEPDAPALVVLDWIMPGMPGVNICRKIRELDRRSYVYVILLTAKNRKEDILEGLEAGADDYLTKPFDPHELKVRVRAGARIVKLQEDLISALQLSDFRASHDGLTSLLNRVAIVDNGFNEMERCRREGHPFALIISDLDHFKRINDRHGHLAGDEVLREVARRMVSSVRPYDSVGRFGGEEFVIVLPGCNTEEGRTIAERIRSSICSAPVVAPEGLIPITMSLGVAAFDCGSPLDMEGLLKNADEALYRAKKNGRNRVEVCQNGAASAARKMSNQHSGADNVSSTSGLDVLQMQQAREMETGPYDRGVPPSIDRVVRNENVIPLVVK